MWYGAQIAEAIRDYGPDYGFTSEQTRFDFATLRKNREAYIDRSRNSYDGSFKRNGVERIEGRARFVDAHTVEVNGETIKAKHIVIATGAHPLSLLFLELNLAKLLMMSLLGKNSLHLLPLSGLATSRWN